MKALVRTTHAFFEEYCNASMRVSQETLRSVMDVDKPDQLADIIAANVLTRLEDRQAILEKLKVKDRLEALCGILVRETELADVEKQVQARIKKQIEKNQKDYYLREQIKAIQTELGDKDGTDVEDLRERIDIRPVDDVAEVIRAALVCEPPVIADTPLELPLTAPQPAKPGMYKGV